MCIIFDNLEDRLFNDIKYLAIYIYMDEFKMILKET